jgi:bifunctional non-homologous end joining protein LigD
MTLPPNTQIEAADLMLATLGRRAFSDENWLFQLKYDGYRCLVRKTGEHAELLSREGNSLNLSFPDVVQAVAALPGDFVLDAELTVDDASGRSSFERLRRRAVTKKPANVGAAAREHPARLYLFDALSLNGRDLRALPLIERQGHLRGALDDPSTLIVASGIVGAGHFVFEQAASLDLEGMVAKRLASPYQRGRSRDWIKVKYANYSRTAALGFGRTKEKSPA